MQKIISWDCGIRTLAHARAVVNTNALVDLFAAGARLRALTTASSAVSTTTLAPTLDRGALMRALMDIEAAIDSFILLCDLRVNDLTANAPAGACVPASTDDTDADPQDNASAKLERAKALVRALADTGPADIVLIEDQPAAITSTKTRQRGNKQIITIIKTAPRAAAIEAQLTYHYALHGTPTVLLAPALRADLCDALCARTRGVHHARSTTRSTKYATNKAQSVVCAEYLIGALGLPDLLRSVKKKDDPAEAIMNLVTYALDCAVGAYDRVRVAQ